MNSLCVIFFAFIAIASASDNSSCRCSDEPIFSVSQDLPNLDQVWDQVGNLLDSVDHEAALDTLGNILGVSSIGSDSSFDINEDEMCASVNIVNAEIDGVDGETSFNFFINANSDSLDLEVCSCNTGDKACDESLGEKVEDALNQLEWCYENWDECQNDLSDMM